MHVNHQAKGQGGSLLVRNLDIGVTVIYSFVDVIAQGVLVRRKSQKKNPDFPLILLTQICRCWEVWNRKLSVIVVPSILALISLGKSSQNLLANCKLAANSGSRWNINGGR